LIITQIINLFRISWFALPLHNCFILNRSRFQFRNSLSFKSFFNFIFSLSEEIRALRYWKYSLLFSFNQQIFGNWNLGWSNGWFKSTIFLFPLKLLFVKLDFTVFFLFFSCFFPSNELSFEFKANWYVTWFRYFYYYDITSSFLIRFELPLL
jgi:hypothetical protein